MSQAINAARLFRAWNLKLTQDLKEFWFQFGNFPVKESVYIACLSVLSLNNLKPHKTYIKYM